MLQSAALRRAAIKAAAARRHALILVYHRIGPQDATGDNVVQTLSEEIFRHQLQMLAELGDIVPLRDLLQPFSSSRRLRFVITLDDDYPNHVDYALPILQSLGLRASFFLSGRAIHGLGPYWWERLELAIASHGLDEVGKMLGLPGKSPQEIAAAYEGSPVPERLEAIASPTKEQRRLGSSGIRALADAGMEIGFHTLHHPLLTGLSQQAVDQAVVEGRKEIAAAANKAIDVFAYPHGKACHTIARRVQALGYQAACTGVPRPVGPSSDRFLLGRWEPGPLRGEQFLAAIVLYLNRPVVEPPP
jgi:peptidoglycan/xylan/chitin deacetylase (PgdA/CDA1 family)